MASFQAKCIKAPTHTCCRRSLQNTPVRLPAAPLHAHAPSRAAVPPPRHTTQLQWAPERRSLGTLNDADDVPCDTLHCASREGQAELVRQMLRAGADVNEAGEGGDTPLHLASCADMEREEVVELLLAAGADVHAANEAGATPLDHATYQGHGYVTTRLLAAGAEVKA